MPAHHTTRFFRAALAVMALGVCGSALAAFEMNFLQRDPAFPNEGRLDIRCNRADAGADVNCGGTGSGNNDPTPFIQEHYIDPTTGYGVYHIMVGRPQDGFSQEVYIRDNGPAWEGGAGSAALGDGTCRENLFNWGTQCNAYDPLGATHDNDFTGNGSGNPKAVVMRQLMGGTWNESTRAWSCENSDDLCFEFLKDDMLRKPMVSLTVRDSLQAMTSKVIIDMRNSDYNTMNVPGTMVNTLTFDSPNMSGASFNYATDAQPGGTVVTAGRYIFTGSGPTNASQNPYSYWSGNFELDQDWTLYKH